MRAEAMRRLRAAYPQWDTDHQNAFDEWVNLRIELARSNPNEGMHLGVQGAATFGGEGQGIPEALRALHNL